MGGNIYCISCLRIKYFLVNWFILCLREAVKGGPSGCYRPICTSRNIPPISSISTNIPQNIPPNNLFGKAGPGVPPPGRGSLVQPAPAAALQILQLSTHLRECDALHYFHQICVRILEQHGAACNGVKYVQSAQMVTGLQIV